MICSIQNLGTWIRIIDDCNKGVKDVDIKEFYQILKGKFDKEILTIIKEACDFISQKRNPISHKEIISIDDVINIRIQIIELMNKVIDKLY